MKYLKLSLLLAILIGFSSCSDDDETPLMEPAERIVGTWTINSTVALGITVPDGSSTLTFHQCGDSNCEGADFEAIDDTSGTFTYTLNAEGSAVTIIDTSLDGGAYNGTWQITDFTNSTMTLTGSTILGDVVFNMSK